MKLKIEQIKVNPIHDQIYSSSDIEGLQESMNKDGSPDPIIVSPDRTIIRGHRRYLMAKYLGWKDIEVTEKSVEKDEMEYQKWSRSI